MSCHQDDYKVVSNFGPVDGMGTPEVHGRGVAAHSNIGKPLGIEFHACNLQNQDLPSPDLLYDTPETFSPGDHAVSPRSRCNPNEVAADTSAGIVGFSTLCSRIGSWGDPWSIHTAIM